MNFEADGHIFGNFHAYYSFNPVHERLRFMDVQTTNALKRALLVKESTEDAADETFTIIDIGCNEGDLTIGLYNALTGQETLAPAVPVDDVVSFDLANICTLNERVQKNKWQVEYVIEDHGKTNHRRRYVCGLQINNKVMGHGEGVSKKVAKAKAAEMALRSLDDKNQVQREREEESSNTNGVLGQLPVAEEEPVMRKKLMVLGVDLDEALIERAANKPVQLDEGDVVQFRRVDVMTSKFSKEIAPFLELAERAAAKRKFDFVTCFSVTMWIHLNNGDDGLWKFLETVSVMTEHLIIEPQTWKCYRNARKRLNRRHVEVPQCFNEIKVPASPCLESFMPREDGQVAQNSASDDSIFPVLSRANRAYVYLAGLNSSSLRCAGQSLDG
uniref:RNA methyltransferase n=1 Tax=Hyaloperonospora arabidopsidis (strain Emoy2) TaxID=559515 RepID=M4BIA2_HYAAE